MEENTNQFHLTTDARNLLEKAEIGNGEMFEVGEFLHRFGQLINPRINSYFEACDLEFSQETKPISTSRSIFQKYLPIIFHDQLLDTRYVIGASLAYSGHKPIDPLHLLASVLAINAERTGSEVELAEGISASDFEFVLFEHFVERSCAKQNIGTLPDTQGNLPTFDVWIDPGNASKDQIATVLHAISDLNRALGGAGLIFAPDRNQKPLTVCHA